MKASTIFQFFHKQVHDKRGVAESLQVNIYIVFRPNNYSLHCSKDTADLKVSAATGKKLSYTQLANTDGRKL